MTTAAPPPLAAHSSMAAAAEGTGSGGSRSSKTSIDSQRASPTPAHQHQHQHLFSNAPHRSPSSAQTEEDGRERFGSSSTGTGASTSNKGSTSSADKPNGSSPAMEYLPATSTSTAGEKWERPRVIVDGPGGADTKQGAKIACLECRTAKIKCSAPTDGVVPCRRCVRHGRECIFEKHRRGRKPGRATSHNRKGGKSVDAGRAVSSDAACTRHKKTVSASDATAGPSSAAASADALLDMPLSALAAASALASSGTQRDEPSSAHQRSSIAQIGAGTGAPHFGTRVTPSIPAPQYLQWSPASANFHDTLPQSLSPRSLGSADQRQRTGSAEAQHHQPQQHIMPQHAPHPLYGSHYTYPASSSRTPAHYTATPSGVPAQAYGNYTHSFPTSYPLTTSVSSSGIARSSALQQQPSLLPLSADQSSASNRVWFDQSSPNTRNLFSPPIAGSPALASADSATAEESAQSTSKRCGDDTHVADPRRQERASTSERSYTPGSSNNLSVRVVSPKEKHSGLSSPRKHHATSGDTLLSDEEEEYVDEGDEDEEDQLVDDDCVDGDLMSNVLSNPLRLLAQASDAAAARIEAGPNSIAAAETMGLITPSLTKSSTTSALGGVARAVESERRSAVSTGSGSPQNQRSSRPPLLGSIGRSRSYPARQPVVTSSDKAAQAQKSNSSSSTLHNSDQWEYREGRARARRETHSGAQDGGGNATSSGSNTTGAETSAAGPAAPDSVLGKRRRSRSRKGGRRSSRRRETRKEGAATREAQQGENAAPGEQEAGASRKGYFNLSLFHSKLDDDPALDPVDLGMLDQKEVEKLFDIFFNCINPVLNLFDPFLHSTTYVRMRSAFLTTVITSLAARFSDTPRDAKLAVQLEKHWQLSILPQILLGGYKSVEIAQAFLILTTYHKPTNTLVDDRSWQYLGFAIRTATEIGVNRRVTPNVSVRGNEQVRRRVRNRERLWYNLFLFDRSLSAQTGRPWTISDDRMIVQSSQWHREDFALPEDVSLVSLIKLRRVTAQHVDTFDIYLSTAEGSDVSGERRLAGLEFFRKNANADLDMWKEAWCVADRRDVTDDTPGGAFLIRWAPTAKLFYHHSRLLLNSLVLQATEEHEEFVSPVYVDCWSCAISLIGIMLEDFGEKNLVYVTNGTVVMAVYAAIFALRLTKLDHVKFPFVDRDAIINLVRHLAEVLSRAGRTPTHRNGAAGPYGNYLRSVLSLWESPLSTPEEDVTPSDDRRDSHGREGEVVRKAVSGAATPSGAVGTNSSGSGGGAIAHAILTPANFQSPGTSTGDSGSTPSSTMLQQQQMNTANVPLLGQVSDNVGTDVWGATTSINADSVLSDPESLERMWDYLTQFEPGGFSASLWAQPGSSNWGGQA